MLIQFENKLCVWFHTLTPAPFSTVIKINRYYWKSSVSHMKHIRNPALWTSAIYVQNTEGTEQLTLLAHILVHWHRAANSMGRYSSGLKLEVSSQWALTENHSAVPNSLACSLGSHTGWQHHYTQNIFTAFINFWWDLYCVLLFKKLSFSE